MTPAWLKAALIGIEQDVPFAMDGAIGALLVQAGDGTDPALDFCRRAGVVAACSLAAMPIDMAQAELPVPSAPDPKILSDAHPWAAAVASAFSTGPVGTNWETRLKHEACARLAEIGASLPFTLLPRALTAGQRNQTLRSALLPVLGSRGRWLAAQNVDWAFAANLLDPKDGDDLRLWQEGRHLERLAIFTRLRTTDARHARELLEASLGELPAKERIDFVAALDSGLGADDTRILELLLKDRSRDVRISAARLLAMLPDSAHARQLVDWLSPLLTQRRGLLGKSWQIEAPESADPAWGVAAIEATRPQHEPLGERAWWLYQLARQVPLRWWTQHTGLDAKALVTWAGKTDWKDALLRAWCERVGRDEPEWIEALLTAGAKEVRGQVRELLAQLPVALREKHWADNLGTLLKDGSIGDVIGAFAPGEAMSSAYSRRLFPSVLACFADDRLRQDYGLRGVVLELATLVHPDALRGAGPIPRRADETPAMADCAQDFERILGIRTVLHTHP